ncbi:hypothetical protein ONZ45_g6730 [Pleurotus djamor]|nr:hypothetical protein ONZ45_g6730 [Pleurotus djamor]
MSSSHTHDLEKGTVAHDDKSSLPVEKPFHQHNNYASNGNGNGVVAHTPAPRPSTISNPGPLGLFSFASTTFILSLYNANARDIHTPNAVVGMAVFCGGLAQLLAGMWEFPRGNTFAATAFTSYGAFWMSYATIQIPSSGIIAAYSTPDELHQALAIYLTAWTLITFYFFIAALRKSIAFITLFGFLTLTFLLLAAGDYSGVSGLGRAAGVTGVVTAFVAWYIGVAELLASEKKRIGDMPLGVF